ACPYLCSCCLYLALFSPYPLSSYSLGYLSHLPSFPTRRSSDLSELPRRGSSGPLRWPSGSRRHRLWLRLTGRPDSPVRRSQSRRSEEHTSELQSPDHLVCRLLLEKKKSCR